MVPAELAFESSRQLVRMGTEIQLGFGQKRGEIDRRSTTGLCVATPAFQKRTFGWTNIVRAASGGKVGYEQRVQSGRLSFSRHLASSALSVHLVFADPGQRPASKRFALPNYEFTYSTFALRSDRVQ